MSVVRRRPLAVAVAVTLLTLSACSADGPEPSEPTSGSGDGSASGSSATSAADDGTSAPGNPAGATVELLDSGNGERRVLHLEVDEGLVERTTLEITSTIDADQAARPLTLAMTVPVTTTVRSVDDDGVDAETVIGRATVGDGVDAATRRGIEKSVGFLEGVELAVTYRPDGTVSQSRVDVGDDAPDLVRRLVEDLLSQSAGTAMVFPGEEVGVGARWRATSSLSVSGVTVEQVATYTLEQLQGDGYTISVTVEQTQQPGVALGGGRVVAGATTLDSTVESSLAHLYPEHARSSGKGSTTVSIGGQEVTSAFTTEVVVTTR